MQGTTTRQREPSGSSVGFHNGPQMSPDGRPYQWRCTARPPWVKRHENRRRNRAARASRKRNRT